MAPDRAAAAAYQEDPPVAYDVDFERSCGPPRSPRRGCCARPPLPPPGKPETRRKRPKRRFDAADKELSTPTTSIIETLVKESEKRQIKLEAQRKERREEERRRREEEARAKIAEALLRSEGQQTFTSEDTAQSGGSQAPPYEARRGSEDPPGEGPIQHDRKVDRAESFDSDLLRPWVDTLQDTWADVLDRGRQTRVINDRSARHVRRMDEMIRAAVLLLDSDPSNWSGDPVWNMEPAETTPQPFDLSKLLQLNASPITRSATGLRSRSSLGGDSEAGSQTNEDPPRSSRGGLTFAPGTSSEAAQNERNQGIAQLRQLLRSLEMASVDMSMSGDGSNRPRTSLSSRPSTGSIGGGGHTANLLMGNSAAMNVCSEPDEVARALEDAKKWGQKRADRVDEQWLNYLSAEVFRVPMEELRNAASSGRGRMEDFRTILQLQGTLGELTDRKARIDGVLEELRRLKKDRPAAKSAMKKLEKRLLEKLEERTKVDFKKATQQLLVEMRDRQIDSNERIASQAGVRNKLRDEVEKRMIILDGLQRDWGPRQIEKLHDVLKQRRLAQQECQERVKVAKQDLQQLRDKLKEARQALADVHPNATVREQLHVEVDMHRGKLIQSPEISKIVTLAIVNADSGDQGLIPEKLKKISQALHTGELGRQNYFEGWAPRPLQPEFFNFQEVQDEMSTRWDQPPALPFARTPMPGPTLDQRFADMLESLARPSRARGKTLAAPELIRLATPVAQTLARRARGKQAKPVSFREGEGSNAMQNAETLGSRGLPDPVSEVALHLLLGSLSTLCRASRCCQVLALELSCRAKRLQTEAMLQALDVPVQAGGGSLAAARALRRAWLYIQGGVNFLRGFSDKFGEKMFEGVPYWRAPAQELIAILFRLSAEALPSSALPGTSLNTTTTAAAAAAAAAARAKALEVVSLHDLPGLLMTGRTQVTPAPLSDELLRALRSLRTVMALQLKVKCWTGCALRQHREHGDNEMVNLSMKRLTQFNSNLLKAVNSRGLKAAVAGLGDLLLPLEKLRRQAQSQHPTLNLGPGHQQPSGGLSLSNQEELQNYLEPEQLQHLAEHVETVRRSSKHSDSDISRDEHTEVSGDHSPTQTQWTSQEGASRSGLVMPGITGARTSLMAPEIPDTSDVDPSSPYGRSVMTFEHMSELGTSPKGVNPFEPRKTFQMPTHGRPTAGGASLWKAIAMMSVGNKSAIETEQEIARASSAARSPSAGAVQTVRVYNNIVRALGGPRRDSDDSSASEMPSHRDSHRTRRHSIGTQLSASSVAESIRGRSRESKFSISPESPAESPPPAPTLTIASREYAASGRGNVSPAAHSSPEASPMSINTNLPKVNFVQGAAHVSPVAPVQEKHLDFSLMGSIIGMSVVGQRRRRKLIILDQHTPMPSRIEEMGTPSHAETELEDGAERWDMHQGGSASGDDDDGDGLDDSDNHGEDLRSASLPLRKNLYWAVAYAGDPEARQALHLQLQPEPARPRVSSAPPRIGRSSDAHLAGHYNYFSRRAGSHHSSLDGSGRGSTARLSLAGLTEAGLLGAIRLDLDLSKSTPRPRNMREQHLFSGRAFIGPSGRSNSFSLAADGSQHKLEDDAAVKTWLKEQCHFAGGRNAGLRRANTAESTIHQEEAEKKASRMLERLPPTFKASQGLPGTPLPLAEEAGWKLLLPPPEPKTENPISTRDNEIGLPWDFGGPSDEWDMEITPFDLRQTSPANDGRNEVIGTKVYIGPREITPSPVAVRRRQVPSALSDSAAFGPRDLASGLGPSLPASTAASASKLAPIDSDRMDEDFDADNEGEGRGEGSSGSSAVKGQEQHESAASSSSCPAAGAADSMAPVSATVSAGETPLPTTETTASKPATATATKESSAAADQAQAAHDAADEAAPANSSPEAAAAEVAESLGLATAPDAIGKRKHGSMGGFFESELEPDYPVPTVWGTCDTVSDLERSGSRSSIDSVFSDRSATKARKVHRLLRGHLRGSGQTPRDHTPQLEVRGTSPHGMANFATMRRQLVQAAAAERSSKGATSAKPSKSSTATATARASSPPPSSSPLHPLPHPHLPTAIATSPKLETVQIQGSSRSQSPSPSSRGRSPGRESKDPSSNPSTRQHSPAEARRVPLPLLVSSKAVPRSKKRSTLFLDGYPIWQVHDIYLKGPFKMPGTRIGVGERRSPPTKFPPGRRNSAANQPPVNLSPAAQWGIPSAAATAAAGATTSAGAGGATPKGGEAEKAGKAGEGRQTSPRAAAKGPFDDQEVAQPMCEASSAPSAFHPSLLPAARLASRYGRTRPGSAGVAKPRATTSTVDEGIARPTTAPATATAPAEAPSGGPLPAPAAATAETTAPAASLAGASAAAAKLPQTRRKLSLIEASKVDTMHYRLHRGRAGTPRRSSWTHR